MVRLSVDKVKAGEALTRPVPVIEVREVTPNSAGIVRIKVQLGGRGLILRNWRVITV